MKPAEGRLIIKSFVKAKEEYKLTDGVTIRLIRGEENFNLREVNAVQGIVLGGEYDGCEVLMNHNSQHKVNEILDHDIELPRHTRLYAIPIQEIYAYRKPDTEEWEAMEGQLIVERIWQPYSGFLIGIDPKVISNKLFVVKGNFLHKVISTGLYCDYTVVYQGSDNREKTLTRMKDDSGLPHGGEEVLAIDYDMTEKVLFGELLIGETATKAKKFAGE